MDTSMALLSPLCPGAHLTHRNTACSHSPLPPPPCPRWLLGHISAHTPCPPIVPWRAALPETLMGTMLVWMELGWCHCFSSTGGKGKALGQGGCLSGLVGRLREVSGGRALSTVLLVLSSSAARWLEGCGEKGMSAIKGTRVEHKQGLAARPATPELTISTNSMRLAGGGRGDGSGEVSGGRCPAARKVCPVTLLSMYCSSYSSARKTAPGTLLLLPDPRAGACGGMVTVPSGCPQPSWPSQLRTGSSEREEGKPQGGAGGTGEVQRSQQLTLLLLGDSQGMQWVSLGNSPTGESQELSVSPSCNC